MGEANDFPIPLSVGAAATGIVGVEIDCSDPFLLDNDNVGDWGTAARAAGITGGGSSGESGTVGAAPAGMAGEEGLKKPFMSVVVDDVGAPSGLGVGANRRVAVVADGDGGNRSVIPRCMSDVIEGTFSTSFNTGREGVWW